MRVSPKDFGLGEFPDIEIGFNGPGETNPRPLLDVADTLRSVMGLGRKFGLKTLDYVVSNRVFGHVLLGEELYRGSLNHVRLPKPELILEYPDGPYNAADWEASVILLKAAGTTLALPLAHLTVAGAAYFAARSTSRVLSERPKLDFQSTWQPKEANRLLDGFLDQIGIVGFSDLVNLYKLFRHPGSLL